MDIIDEQEIYAQNCIKPGNVMEQDFLNNMKEAACHFMGEGVTAQKGYAQVVTDQDGYLAHGVIRYYFEMDNGRIAEVDYSKAVERIYSLWNISLDSFEEETKKDKITYEKDGYTYQITEFD